MLSSRWYTPENSDDEEPDAKAPDPTNQRHGTRREPPVMPTALKLASGKTDPATGMDPIRA
jgi:hypothetical protein